MWLGMLFWGLSILFFAACITASYCFLFRNILLRNPNFNSERHYIIDTESVQRYRQHTKIMKNTLMLQFLYKNKCHCFNILYHALIFVDKVDGCHLLCISDYYLLLYQFIKYIILRVCDEQQAVNSAHV